MLNLKVDIKWVLRPRILDLNLVILRLCCQYGRWNNGWFINLSLVLTFPLLSLPISRPQLSCNHLLLLQVSNLEQIRGRSGENNGRDMRGTDRWHNLKRKFVLHHAKSKLCNLSIWKSKIIEEDVEFFTIRANKKICRVLIYFPIVDFYLKTSCYFWPSLFWFLVHYDSNLLSRKNK